jgi:hypothetical protein
MKLFQHKALGGAIKITDAPMYECTPGYEAGVGNSVATFSNDDAGQFAFGCFKAGLLNGENSLFNEDSGQFDIGDLADLIEPQRVRSRSIIHGVNSEGQRVFARQIGGVVVWHSEVPTPEEDVMDGSMSEANRAVYEEIKANWSGTIRDISDVNYQGPKVLELTAADLNIR